MQRLSSLLIIGMLLVAVTGCACKIGSVDNYQPVPLKENPVMPSRNEVYSSRYKVAVLRADESHIRAARHARLGKTVQVKLEEILSKTGDVEFVNREESGQLMEEFISLAEKGIEKGDFKGDAEYVVYSKITKATLTHKFTEASVWEDKKGKQHLIPPQFTYTANVAGNIKIYKMQGMRILKTVNFDDNAQTHENTRSTQIYRKRDDNLMEEACKKAINQARIDILKFFSPKGYIIKGKRKDNIYIFETTLGRGRVKQGDRVAIYTSEIERNPLTKQKEISEWVVTNGIVSEHCGSSKSWILVKERGADVRLGDYIKVNYKKGIFDAIKGAGSALNAILE